MAAVRTLVQTCFKYRVSTDTGCGAESWFFTIVVNQDGTIGVKDIKGPYGPLCNTGTQIPQDVFEEIQAAKEQVENILAQTSAINGTLNFVDQTSQSITFTNPMVNTEYRVYVTLEDFIDWRIQNKTTTGFDIELNVTYTGPVQYDVFV